MSQRPEERPRNEHNHPLRTPPGQIKPSHGSRDGSDTKRHPSGGSSGKPSSRESSGSYDRRIGGTAGKTGPSLGSPQPKENTDKTLKTPTSRDQTSSRSSDGSGNKPAQDSTYSNDSKISSGRRSVDSKTLAIEKLGDKASKRKDPPPKFSLSDLSAGEVSEMPLTDATKATPFGSAMAIRLKSDSPIPGGQMILARGFHHAIRSGLLFDCYKITSSGLDSKGLKVADALSQRREIKTLVNAAVEKAQVPAFTDYRNYLVLFGSQPASGLSLGDGDFHLQRIDSPPTSKILAFVNSRTLSPELRVSLETFKILASQMRLSLNPSINLSSSQPLFSVCSQRTPSTTTSSGDGQNIADLMQSFPHGLDQPGSLEMLENYLKGLKVFQKLVRKDKTLRRTILGLARVTDGEKGSLPFAPIVNKFGGNPSEVQFYFDPSGRDNPRPTTLGIGHVDVAAYYADKQQTIEHTKLPILNVGSRSNPIYVPPELCTLRSLPKWNASGFSFSDIGDIQALRDNPEAIKQFDHKGKIRYPGLKKVLADDLKNCQISISPKSLLIQGRTKAGPTLRYGQITAKDVKMVSGKWGTREASLTPPESKPLRFTILEIKAGNGGTSIDKDTKDLLEQRLRMRNIWEGSTSRIDCQIVGPRNGDSLESEMLTAIEQHVYRYSKKFCVVAIVVLPSKHQSSYDKVKRVCDKSGVKSICIEMAKLRRSKLGYLDHLALKINLKTGGSNQSISQKPPGRAINLEETMIVGLEAILPPKKIKPTKKAEADSKLKGVAAVVASIQSDLSQWPSTTALLDTKEPHTTFSELLEARIRFWKHQNQKKSLKQIIVYHSGLTTKASPEEISKFQAICQEHSVKLTLIAVSTDHETHLESPPTANESETPKLIADGAVIVPSPKFNDAWDFVIQGRTSRKIGMPKEGAKDIRGKPVLKAKDPHAVRYSVLYSNSLEEPADRKELEDFTHNMCYLSGFSATVVSHTLPVHYVRSLCNRVQSYVRPWYYPEMGKERTDGMTAETIKVGEDVKDTMFYV